METRSQPCGPGNLATERRGNGGGEYCAYCGTELTHVAPAIRRFGEPLCGEPHAVAFASEVRSKKARAPVPDNSGTSADVVPAGGGGQTCGTGAWTFARVAKWVGCCGVPLLAKQPEAVVRVRETARRV